MPSTRALLAASATAVLLTAGCGDHHGPSPTPGTPRSVSTTAPSTTAPSNTAPRSRPPAPTATVTDSVTVYPTPGEPDPDHRERYLVALNIIEPDIVHGDPDTAVLRGKQQCATMIQFPDDYSQQVGITDERFTSPAHPNGYGLTIARLILDTVHTWICSDYPFTPDPPGP